MIKEKKVRGLIAEALDGTDQFLVDLRIGVDNHIFVEIDDRVGSISITDCVRVSRAVEHNLDRDETDFKLDVTSPGLDKAFKVHEQYVKNVGRHVKVRPTVGKTIEGLLKEVDEEKVTVMTREKRRIEGRKSKEWVEEDHVFAFTDIEETKIVISFK
jgi:ribosome maturation factor RimP